ASSAGVFGAIADMLVAIYKRAGFWPIIKWVDDFLVIRLPGQSWSEEDFIALTANLGVPWSLTKLRRFSTVQRYIGFDWNLDNKTVEVPPEKIKAMFLLLDRWQAPDALFAGHEAASLHGKLVHISSIHPLIRPFLPSCSRFAQEFHSKRAKLRPPTSLLADL